MKNAAQFKQLFTALFLAVTFAGGLASCASTPTSESTGQYVDDATITTKVKAAIFEDPQLKVFQIKVETFKGEVQLSGFVDSAATASRAVRVASGVKGVRSVKNNLIVK